MGWLEDLIADITGEEEATPSFSQEAEARARATEQEEAQARAIEEATRINAPAYLDPYDLTGEQSPYAEGQADPSVDPRNLGPNAQVVTGSAAAGDVEEAELAALDAIIRRVLTQNPELAEALQSHTGEQVNIYPVSGSTSTAVGESGDPAGATPRRIGRRLVPGGTRRGDQFLDVADLLRLPQAGEGVEGMTQEGMTAHELREALTSAGQGQAAPGDTSSAGWDASHDASIDQENRASAARGATTRRIPDDDLPASHRSRSTAGPPVNRRDDAPRPSRLEIPYEEGISRLDTAADGESIGTSFLPRERPDYYDEDIPAYLRRD